MTLPRPEPLSSHNIVDFLEDIFARRGGEEYLGEPVTMAQHMLQAAQAAQQAGASDEVVVAALLHDIGHFTSELGTFAMTDSEDRFHQNAGAKVLEGFFPQVIVDCVRHHVAAKRYLCAVDPAYRAKLSEASIHSLQLQGGPLSLEEVAAFEKQPHLAEIIEVRHCDDSGKQAGLPTASFADYAPLIQKVVEAHCGQL